MGTPERGELSVRPAWWREFLQKVKMFFYGFKGFSNYRFTDKEIETLLLRGYRKTRAGGGSKFKVEGSRLDTVRTTADRPQERARFSIDEEGKPLFNVQGYGEQKLESILQDKSISAKTQILTDDGSPDWGRVTPEMIANAPEDLNLKALPIRLFKGDYGYGLVHLSKHLKDFTGRDLSNVILNVFGKPNKIYARRDGDAIKLEVFPKPPSQWGILELREEQGCYSVVTFYPRDNAHSKPKGEMIWRFGSQTETSQAASDQSRNGATGETPQVTQEETTVQTSHNINPFDIKVKYALEDGSDFSDGADKYTLENAKASKEGYRVERVNENAGRDLTEAQGVVCEVNQVFNPEDAPEKGFKGWVLNKIREYETAHPLKGKYDTPALDNEVNIVESSIRSIGNHAGPDAKYNLYPAIPDMLKNAVLIQTEAHDAQGSSSVLSRSHLLTAKVRYGENRYVVVMVIHESNGEFYYDHSLLLLKEGELGNRKAEINEAEESKWNPAKTAGPASSSAQVLKVAREALLSSGFDTKSEKNLRFSIEQYSDADWSDMVTYMKAKVGDLLTKSDAEYKKILESAGMECYSEADAHACAVEAMNANLEDAKARRKEEMMKWIVENNTWIQRIAEVTGSPEFKIRPSYRFQGMDFTGAYISQAWRKCSGNPKVKNREKRLREASGYHSDELAQMIADKFGGDGGAAGLFGFAVINPGSGERFVRAIVFGTGVDLEIFAVFFHKKFGPFVGVADCIAFAFVAGFEGAFALHFDGECGGVAEEFFIVYGVEMPSAFCEDGGGFFGFDDVGGSCVAIKDFCDGGGFGFVSRVIRKADGAVLRKCRVRWTLESVGGGAALQVSPVGLGKCRGGAARKGRSAGGGC